MSDCIEWEGRLHSGGYGLKYMDGKTYYTHRLEWSKHNGPIPEGMFVCHRCDNPPCYNVDHLFLGTPKDNVRDMYAKGRTWQPKGEDRKNAKLTWEKVAKIRELYAAGGHSHRSLARMFGVGSHRTIGLVIRNEQWVV